MIDPEPLRCSDQKRERYSGRRLPIIVHPITHIPGLQCPKAHILQIDCSAITATLHLFLRYPFFISQLPDEIITGKKSPVPPCEIERVAQMTDMLIIDISSWQSCRAFFA